MSVLPANIARVPSLLTSQLVLSNLNRTNLSLLDVQSQLASGRRVNRPSDDPVAAAAIGVLDDALARAQQRGRNLSAADTLLSTLDSSLGSVTDLVRQAQSIASSQIGVNSDATTRAQQAVVVDSLIQTLLTSANTQDRGTGLYLFGGGSATDRPFNSSALGVRYTARGDGLVTDLGLGDGVRITMAGQNAIGETSARQRGLSNLSPALTADTPVSALRGARGLGVQPGPITLRFNSGPSATVDLTGAANPAQIAARLTNAIRQYETDNGVTILGPGGVSATPTGLNFDIASGSLAFTDPTGSTTAADLGLSQAPLTNADGAAEPLNPRLTPATPLSAVPGLTLPLGSLRVRLSRGDAVTVRDINLSGAQTIDDVRNAIESANLGVRVRINDAGTALDVFNENSGPALSIEETPATPPAIQTTSAAQLGLRTLSPATALADFNFGRGVSVVDGVVNPTTGAVDPALNSDLRIRLGNGSTFDVDLRPQDLTSVQTLLDRINAQAAAAVSAGQIPPGSFQAALNPTTNAIAFRDTAGLGPISVTGLNNSGAAFDLGLSNGGWDAASATFVAQDRSGVRVDSLFTDLMDLRDALRGNDSAGITLAGQRLEASSDRLVAANALVGSLAQRVEEASSQLDDQKILDTKTKSELQDVDFSEAATRFSLLQNQLQAVLQTAGRFQNLSLLDFLR